MERKACISLYKSAFGSSEPFDSLLFEGFFDNLKTLETDGRLVSQLFLLPCELAEGDRRSKAYYIYAAATDENFRGRGYMRRLMDRVCCEDAFYFLKPADNSLVEFYKKLGFECVKAVKNSDAYIGVDGYWKELQELYCDCPDEYILMYKSGRKKYDFISFEYPME